MRLLPATWVVSLMTTTSHAAATATCSCSPSTRDSHCTQTVQPPCCPTGPSHYPPGGQSPSPSFGGFPPPASTSPFLNFSAQQSPQGDNMFPNLAPQMQPTAPQPGSATLGNWGSGSGPGSGSGDLSQQYSHQGRPLQVRLRHVADAE